MTVHKDKMRNIIKKCTVVYLAVLLCAQLVPVCAFASDKAGFSAEYEDDDYLLYKNDASGYEILIDDQADILTESEERDLSGYMADCSEGGYVLFVTTDYNDAGTAYNFAENYYRSRIPEESGILFLIDMDTRELKFYSEGTYHNLLKGSTLNIIADNVYRDASKGDYYLTAKEAFIEISSVLNGKRIAAPMKYISNACLAILFALIINYFLVRGLSGKHKASDSDILGSINSRFSFTDANATHTNTSRKYSPRSSSSGGGSRGGGGGGGHSSGGHSF